MAQLKYPEDCPECHGLGCTYDAGTGHRDSCVSCAIRNGIACCKFDYNLDGNCHIHSAPGVLRNRWIDDIGMEKATPAQIQAVNDFLDKLIPLPPWGRSIISVYNGPHHTTDFYESVLKGMPRSKDVIKD